jgi:stress-induced-phosphoprotein 1
MSTNDLKDEGNEMFKQKKFIRAVELYTEAIKEAPEDHTLYANRSASFHNLNKYEEALKDGEKCVELQSDWPKGY